MTSAADSLFIDTNVLVYAAGPRRRCTNTPATRLQLTAAQAPRSVSAVK